jgi:hypothetical protein
MPPAPNRLWLSNFTYVSTWSGFRVIDDEAFAALAEKTVLEFHTKSWLAAIMLHQA